LNDGDCSVGTCISSLCVSVSKSCPSNSSMSVCSGAGYCAFRSLDGQSQTTCLIGNSLCYGMCLCYPGYGGNGCSIPPAELAVQDQYRGDICEYLSSLVQENVTYATLADASSLLNQTYVPSLVVSASSILACISTLESIAYQTPNVPLDYNTSQSIADVISSFIDGIISNNAGIQAFNRSSAAAVIDLVSITNILNAFTAFIAQKLPVGSTVNFTTHVFTISVQSKSWNDLYGSSLQISGALPSSITLPSNGLDACRVGNQADHTTFSIMQWNKNPYTNSPIFGAPILRWSHPARELEVAQVRSLLDSEFLLKMAFFTTQRESKSFNYTCLERNGISFSPGDCYLDSHTDEAVVFRCSVIANLCPLHRNLSTALTELRSARTTMALSLPVVSSSSEPLFFTSTSPSRQMSTLELLQQAPEVYDASDYGVLITSVANEIPLVFSTNPFALVSNQSIIVMAVVFLWLIGFIFGLFYYSRWDTRDRQMIVYLPKFKHRQGKSPAFSEMLTLRQRIDNAFLSKSLITEDQMNNEEHFEFNWRNTWIHRINTVVGLCINDDRRRQRFSVVVGGQLIPRLFRALVHFHPYVWMFSNRSMQKTRVIRFMTTFKSILLSIFISTVFFNVFYPSDSICSAYNYDLESCLSLPSKLISGESECGWNSASRECYVKAPPSSASFTITVSIITTFLAIPFDLLFYYLLNVLCCCRPDFERIGWSKFHLLGSELPQDTSELLSPARQEDAILSVIQGLHFFEQRMASDIGESELARIAAVVRAFGLRLENGTIQMTRLSSWLYNGNLREFIGRKIKSSYLKAQKIVTNLGTVDDSGGRDGSDESPRENYLLQCYVLEHFGQLSRTSLRRHFLHFTLEQASPIHPVVWVVAWSVEIAFVIFFIVWILFWGASTPAQNISTWSSNFMLNLMHEIFIISIIRIFIINVLIVEIIAPKLRGLRSRLVALGQKHSRGYFIEDGMSCLTQHLSPSVVASNHSTLRSLPAAKLLRSVDDEEPYKLQSMKNLRGSSRRQVDDEDVIEYHSDQDDDYENVIQISTTGRM
jgi:hypothetical protein